MWKHDDRQTHSILAEKCILTSRKITTQTKTTEPVL